MTAPARRPRTRRGQETRAALLRAAAIADITRAAGIAQGTFYIYFDSKEHVFRELVLEMGRLTRKALSDAVANAPDRLAAERLGLRAFLEIAAARPTLYNVVMEARTVDPASYDAYFMAFATNYARNLSAAADEGTIRPGDATIRAWALMGMAVTLGERFGLDRTQDGARRDQVVVEVFDMLERGLRP